MSKSGPHKDIIFTCKENLDLKKEHDVFDHEDIDSNSSSEDRSPQKLSPFSTALKNAKSLGLNYSIFPGMRVRYQPEGIVSKAIVVHQYHQEIKRLNDLDDDNAQPPAKKKLNF